MTKIHHFARRNRQRVRLGITCGEVIVDALGKKHGCLAARVDGQECDLSTVLT